MKELIDLFVVFAKIGLFSIGGGYAMLPMLQKEIVEGRGWATEAELTDYFAIGQVTPGVIAVNTSTFIGYKRKGIIGGIVATAGMVFPSLVIIVLIATFLRNFADLTVVKYAFNGIKASVCVLILDAIVKMSKNTVTDKICLVIFIAVIFFSVADLLSPTTLVIAAGITGILVKNFVNKKGKTNEGGE